MDLGYEVYCGSAQNWAKCMVQINRLTLCFIARTELCRQDYDFSQMLSVQLCRVQGLVSNPVEEQESPFTCKVQILFLCLYMTIKSLLSDQFVYQSDNLEDQLLYDIWYNVTPELSAWFVKRKTEIYESALTMFSALQPKQ